MKGEGVLGAIEAGGTKWVCGVGTAADGIIEEIVVPTGQPDATLPAVVAAFQDLQRHHGRVTALGVATFGPVGVRPDVAGYGVIQNTPKPGWRGFDFLSAMTACFGARLPMVVETDVNAAAWAESRQPANRDCGSLIYLTVGTGIGGGMVLDKRIWKGRGHPEMGHLLVPESSLELASGFSSCPFHKHCLEGKASGTAMRERWGSSAETWPDDHPGWDLEVDYLAAAVVSLTAGWAPERIVFGGGVVESEPLLPMVRERFLELAGGYWEAPPLDQYVVRSSLKNRAGLVGALMLAAEA